MNGKFLTTSRKDELILMFLSFFYEPIQVADLDELLNSYWRTAYTYLKIDAEDINIVFSNSKAVIKKGNSYIIEDLIMREQYFIKMFNNEKNIFDAFSKDIFNLYPFRDSQFATKARIKMYTDTGDEFKLNIYNEKSIHKYFDFMLNLFYQKKLNFSKYRYIILKIWVHRVWAKVLNFENIDKDIEEFQKNQEYWKIFVNNEKTLCKRYYKTKFL